VGEGEREGAGRRWGPERPGAVEIGPNPFLGRRPMRSEELSLRSGRMAGKTGSLGGPVFWIENDYRPLLWKGSL